MIRCLQSGVLVLLSVTMIQAGEKPQPKQKKQTPLQAAYQKQRELYQKQQALRKKFNESDALKQFHHDLKEAESALKKELDIVQKDARAKEQEARKTFRKVVDKRISESKKIAELEKKHQDLEQQERSLNYQIDLAQFKINHRNSPIQQALDADADLQKLKKAADTAPIKERFDARTRYLKARQTTLKTLKEAKDLYEEMDELRSKYKKVDKAYYQTRLDINRAKARIERGDDKEIMALRDKWSAARQEMVRAVFQPGIVKLRGAVSKARVAQQKKLSELLASSKEMKTLQQQVNEVRKEIRKLLTNKQIQDN